MRDNKLVIIINGKGGCGKDSLIEGLKGFFSVRNISSIDPIKKIARKNGWNGNKDNRSRKFLSDLKEAFTNFNDLPYKYLKRETRRFLMFDETVMFVHIRESSNIDKYREYLKNNKIRSITLLVKRDITDDRDYGNRSDDSVDNYDYSYVFHNEENLSKSIENFRRFVIDVYIFELKTQKV